MHMSQGILSRGRAVLPLCSLNLMLLPVMVCYIDSQSWLLSYDFCRLLEMLPQIWHRVRSRCPLLLTPAPSTVLTWDVSSDTGKRDGPPLVQPFCKYSCRPRWCAFFRCCWSPLVVILLFSCCSLHSYIHLNHSVSLHTSRLRPEAHVPTQRESTQPVLRYQHH